MSIKVEGYTVSWTPYVEGIVEVGEGETKLRVITEVLTYHSEILVARYDGKAKEVVTLEKMPLKTPPELCAFIDPDEKAIMFGTEAEAREAADQAE